MNRMSWHSWDLESVQFSDIRVASLLFADVILRLVTLRALLCSEALFCVAGWESVLCLQTQLSGNWLVPFRYVDWANACVSGSCSQAKMIPGSVQLLEVAIHGVDALLCIESDCCNGLLHLPCCHCDPDQDKLKGKDGQVFCFWMTFL